MNDKTLPAPAAFRQDDTPGAEHAMLARHLAAAQRRCSDVIARQAREIAELRAQAMQMRAAIIARDSALAWAYEDRATLEAANPDLAPRVTLARKVRELNRKLQDLMREKMRPPMGAPLSPAAQARAEGEQMSDLEASVAAADLVICQTGCLSHGDYWRVQDHCKRTGKTCVMVEQAANFRVVRIHQDMRAHADNGAPALSRMPETPETPA
ncbi:DUF2325 domain-containing protein [Herbaspirillum robiniae]|uniref:DUF2325 domain-containing protein n=1 Tax=Herbaspirillum robiniae TaxID=2014887 RepID=UPI003D785333